MQTIDVSVTLTGSPIVLSSNATLAAIFNGMVSKLRFTPGDSNTHVVTVTGPNGNNIKRLSPPSGATEAEDEWDWDPKSGRNLIPLNEISVTGVSGETVNVTAFVG